MQKSVSAQARGLNGGKNTIQINEWEKKPFSIQELGKAQANAEGNNNSRLCNELQVFAGTGEGWVFRFAILFCIYLFTTKFDQEQSNDKKGTTAKKGRQAKKVKLETESHNIKDMFSRASRKKS